MLLILYPKLFKYDIISMVIIMKLITFLLIVIVVLGILAIIYAINYNNLVTYKLKIDKAEGLIDEALRNKYDLIAKINIAIKKVITKKDYLKEYIDLKNKRIGNYDLDRKLTEAHNLILELKEDHKELNTKAVNKDLREIEKLNETLVSCKNYFNKNTSELNILIREFPSNIVAKVHGYKIRPFFDGKNMQDNIIDDFKL